MNSPLVRCVDILLISLWAGVCASVPEVIWQGGRLLLAHGDHEEFLISSLLVGLMLAFFVEPLIERFKARSWAAHHEAQSWTFVTILVSVVFGMVTVCIHQCIESLLHNGGGAGEAHKTAGLHEAIRIAVQWSFVPTIFTATWFVGLRNRTLGNGLIPVASGLAFAVAAFVFHWHVYNAVASTLVGLLTSIVVINPVAARPRLYQGSNDSLRLSLTAGLCFAACTLVLATINTSVVRIDYDGLDYGEDVRFYLGWAIGLSFLPNPYRAASPAGAARHA